MGEALFSMELSGMCLRTRPVSRHLSEGWGGGERKGSSRKQETGKVQPVRLGGNSGEC